MRRRIVFGLVVSLAVGILIGIYSSSFIYANYKHSITVSSGIHLEIDGQKYLPKDVKGNAVDVFLYNGTTYVPIRAIAENFNKEVKWDAKRQTVLIDSKDASEQKTENKKKSNKSQEKNPETRQSKMMLEYTGSPWSGELEEALKEVDFSAYAFDKEEPKEIKDVNSLYVLANKANYFPESFVPIDLVSPKTKYAGGGDRNKMRKAAADALDNLVQAARKAGHDIQNVSAYRSIAYQKVLFDNYAAKDGIEAANKYSSKPGFSEHHTGLCVDVSSPSMGFGLGQEYGKKPEGKWLAKNAHNYGFIIRYPKNKEDITGYTYEPWHIRYLGLPLAAYLYENNLTFEEFLALQLAKKPEEIKYLD